MAYALGVQRLFAGAAALIVLLWAGIAGEPLLGLWLAVWVTGLSCIGAGALVVEDEKRRLGRTRNDLPAGWSRAKLVLASGFGYVTVGMLAGWFHPIAGTVFLALALADFAADHRLAKTVAVASGQAVYQ